MRCILYVHALCSSKYNLNAMSHDSAIGLIHKVLKDGAKIKEVRYRTAAHMLASTDLRGRHG